MTLRLSFYSYMFLLLFVIVSVGSELHSTHSQFAPASVSPYVLSAKGLWLGTSKIDCI